MLNARDIRTVGQRIEEALTELRPFLEADGGDITLEEVTLKVARAAPAWGLPHLHHERHDPEGRGGRCHSPRGARRAACGGYRPEGARLSIPDEPCPPPDVPSGTPDARQTPDSCAVRLQGFSMDTPTRTRTIEQRKNVVIHLRR